MPDNPQPPVHGRASQPPPPPPAYRPPPYPYYPPRPRGPGLFVTFLRVGGGLFLVIALLILGYMAGAMSLTVRATVMPVTYRPGTGDRIAIIPIEGMIHSGTARHVHRVVESILRDDSIRAVVIRVDSPGGGAAASDQIHHALTRLKTERHLPLIASYGGYATSGGYYVSCQSDRIFAEPTCVTGSIGVIAQVPTLQELLEEKLGVRMEVITATDAADKELGNTMYRHWTEADRAVMRKLLDAMHHRFTEVVYQGRQEVLSEEEVRRLADGRVLTVAEALEERLVDEIGYLDAALREAAQAGGFVTETPPVVIYPAPVTVFGLLGSEAGERGPVSWKTALEPDTVRQWLSEATVPQIMMLFQP